MKPVLKQVQEPGVDVFYSIFYALHLPDRDLMWKKRDMVASPLQMLAHQVRVDLQGEDEV